MPRYIQGIIELKQAHGFKAGEVEKVEVEVNPMVPQFIRYSEPRDMAEARFSMPHGLAVAILDDGITLRSFSDERVKAPDAREMRQRVKMIVHEDWQYGALAGPYPLNVTLKGGTQLKNDCVKVNGQPPDFLSVEQVVQKYRLCTEGLVAGDKIQESINDPGLRRPGKRRQTDGRRGESERLIMVSETSSKNYLFRDLPKSLLIGTASDRYAGWIGQILTGAGRRPPPFFPLSSFGR